MKVVMESDSNKWSESRKFTLTSEGSHDKVILTSEGSHEKSF